MNVDVCCLSKIVSWDDDQSMSVYANQSHNPLAQVLSPDKDEIDASDLLCERNTDHCGGDVR